MASYSHSDSPQHSAHGNVPCRLDHGTNLVVTPPRISVSDAETLRGTISENVSKDNPDRLQQEVDVAGHDARHLIPRKRNVGWYTPRPLVCGAWPQSVFKCSQETKGMFSHHEHSNTGGTLSHGTNLIQSARDGAVSGNSKATLCRMIWGVSTRRAGHKPNRLNGRSSHC